MSPKAPRPRTLAILPVKRFASAKERLAEEISAGARRALAESMVTDVLMALRRTNAIDEVVVVTAEPAVDAIGRSYGATVLLDEDEDGQSAAAIAGIAHALDHGAQRVVLVPGDCPALDPAELDALLGREIVDPCVTIVPDRHGTGTNGLVLIPPGVIEPAFGPDSRSRHEQAALLARVPSEVVELDTLALDVDTGDDLAALRVALAQRRGGAAHTRGMLTRIADRGRGT